MLNECVETKTEGAEVVLRIEASVYSSLLIRGQCRGDSPVETVRWRSEERLITASSGSTAEAETTK